MHDARIARVAALYRSGSSTDSRVLTPDATALQAPVRARLWQAALATSMAAIKRRRPEIVPARRPAAQAPLRAVPGVTIVAAA